MICGIDAALQKEIAAKLGIVGDDFCNTRTRVAKQWLMERTEGKGPDIFFECVGRNETIALAITAAAPGGTVLLTGNPASDIQLSRDDYWNILRHQLTVRGTWNSSFTNEADDDWHYALERLAAGRVNPATIISHRMPLEQLMRGLQIMRAKTEEFGKVMIHMVHWE